MKEIVDRFILRMTKSLPGELAHVEMAPIKRPTAEEARIWPETKMSAVLILLYPHRDSIYTALMMRPDYSGVHSQQVSFPGGRKEDVDTDMRSTALREAREELGIIPEKVEIIGQLSDLYIPPSKSLVTPVLGFAAERPDFIPDAREVEAIIEADFYEIMSDKVFGKTEIVRANYILKEVPAIQYGGYTIWGATAMILNELKWLYSERE